MFRKCMTSNHIWLKWGSCVCSSCVLFSICHCVSLWLFRVSVYLWLLCVSVIILCFLHLYLVSLCLSVVVLCLFVVTCHLFSIISKNYDINCPPGSISNPSTRAGVIHPQRLRIWVECSLKRFYGGNSSAWLATKRSVWKFSEGNKTVSYDQKQLPATIVGYTDHMTPYVLLYRVTCKTLES